MRQRQWRHPIRLAFPSILLLGCLSSFGQQARTGTDGGHITGFNDYLKERGFGTSEAELKAAIQSSEPQVRAAASAMLAQQNFPDADSLIVAAIAKETNEQAKTAMAVNLISLKDPVGESVLVSLCSSRDASPQAASMAATYLTIAGLGKACIPTQLEKLRVHEQQDLSGDDLPLLGSLYRQASKSSR